MLVPRAVPAMMMVPVPVVLIALPAPVRKTPSSLLRVALVEALPVIEMFPPAAVTAKPEFE